MIYRILPTWARRPFGVLVLVCSPVLLTIAVLWNGAQQVIPEIPDFYRCTWKIIATGHN